MKYNWQQPGWPNFHYNLTKVQDALFEFAEETGHVTGILKALPADTRMEALIVLVTGAKQDTAGVKCLVRLL